MPELRTRWWRLHAKAMRRAHGVYVHRVRALVPLAFLLGTVCGLALAPFVMRAAVLP